MTGTARLAWGLLDRRERRTAVLLCAAMLAGAVLECLGLGLVLPVLSILSGDGAVLRNLPGMAGALADAPHGLVVIGALLVLLAFHVLKALFRWMLSVRLNRFGFGLQRHLSTRLFGLFLMRPWSFHLGRNTTALLHGVTHDVDQCAFGVIVPILSVVSEGTVILAVTALLVWIEPVGGVASIAFVALAGWWLHRLGESRAVALGQRRRELDRARFRLLRQSFEGVKEIRALGREGGFVALVDGASARSGAMGLQVQSMRDMPRSWIEVLAILGLVTLVASMVLQGRAPESMIGVAAIFALAIIRLVPSATRFMTSVQSIALAGTSIRSLTQELASGAQVPDARSGDEGWSTIGFRGVGFGYDGERGPVLSSLDATIRRGESVGIVGASGAGKSTLVDLALGLLRPTEGSITIGDADLADCTRWWQRRVGYVPQSIYLLDDSVRRNVAFGIPEELIDDHEVDRCLRLACLDGFIATLPEGASTVVGERGVRLSGGQRQRIGIARALYAKPSVLILDEATSALDPETEQGLLDAIHALHGSMTMIVIAHRDATVARCSRILRLDAGRLTEVTRA